MAQEPGLERLGGGWAFTGFLAAQSLTTQLPLHGALVTSISVSE